MLSNLVLLSQAAKTDEFKSEESKLAKPVVAELPKIELSKPITYNKFVSPLSSFLNNVGIGDYGGFNLSAGHETTKINGDNYNIFISRYEIRKSVFKSEENKKKIKPGNSLNPEKHLFYAPEIKQECENNESTNFQWSKWDDNMTLSNLFIGKIKIDGNIQYMQHINYDVDYGDVRIIRLYTNNTKPNTVNSVYLITPREYTKPIKLLYLKYNNSFSYFMCNVKYNLRNKLGRSCVKNKDTNMPCYNITKKDYFGRDPYDFFELDYFIWFENKCVNTFRLNIVIPNLDTLSLFCDNKDDEIITQKNISSYNNYCEKYLSTSESICVRNDCVKDLSDLKGIDIKNQYLYGTDEKYRLKRIPNKSLAFSFGSHFIKLDEDYKLAVGHIKIATLPVEILYEQGSVVNIFRDKVNLIYTSLFNKMHIKHLSIFNDGCYNGYIYASYFILYNKKDHTLKISDFFIPIDINDRYHIPLIFSVGLFKINNTVYLTSGEGDYYSSIMTWDKKDIFDSCIHDFTEKDFHINQTKLYLFIKDLGNNIDRYDVSTCNIEELKRKYTPQINEFYKDLTPQYIPQP